MFEDFFSENDNMLNLYSFLYFECFFDKIDPFEKKVWSKNHARCSTVEHL